MMDYDFYNVGCTGKRGVRLFVVPFRRLLRRALLPMFQRLVNVLQSLSHSQSRLVEEQDRLRQQVADLAEEQSRLRQQVTEIDEDFQALIDLGWDYVSLVRRLTVLERELASLREPKGVDQLIHTSLRVLRNSGPVQGGVQNEAA
jgi:hypothetical protein